MGESKIWPVYKKVIYQFMILLLFYQATRLLFFLINQDYFSEVGLTRYFQLVYHSLRYDLSTIFSINILYLLLALLPFSFVGNALYQRFLAIIFIAFNSIAFLFDLADIGYFPYVRKRMSADVFHLIGRKSDFIDLLPSYLKTFWFVPIAAFIFITLFWWVNKRIVKSYTSPFQSFNLKSIVLYLFSLGVSFIVIRGGLQLKPILNINALLVASNQEAPLVLNTPFSILHTFEQNKLAKVSYLNERTVEGIYHPLKLGHANKSSIRPNIVLVILESFGKQYTSIGGRKSETPFLDSLMKKGYIFTNAFANGHRSADGIPACVAGIPTFMDEAFTTSPYSENTVDAIPSLLSRIGYSTSFFHGGTNGTMSFDIFAKSVGFEKYIGRSEYKNDNDYDGTWGIWDEPFLQFMSNELNHENQPFFSTVFTLSSHEPFKIPTKYESEAFARKKGINRGIAYSDMALKKFFEVSANQSWFKNTLFVITADHNFLANSDSLGYYNNGMGLYSIPILLYHPNDKNLVGESKLMMQQIDILPTIMDYIQYPHSYFAFGQSGFDSSNRRYVYNQMGDHHQFLLDSFLLTADNIDLFSLYNFRADSMLRTPILSDSLRNVYHRSFLAYRQLLTNSMIENTISAKTVKRVK